MPKPRRTGIAKTFLTLLVLITALLAGFLLRGRVGLRLAMIVAGGLLILGLVWVERRYRDPWR